MTRNESYPRSGTEATTEIEATCFLRGKVDFVDKHRTIHFAEKERSHSSTRPIAYVYLHHSRRHEAMIYGLEEDFLPVDAR